MDVPDLDAALASVRHDTVVKCYQERSPNALFYRLQNVTPAEGAALLATTVRVLGAQVTHVTTATLMTPGATDDNLAVYRLAGPAQATALVRMFRVVGCGQPAAPNSP
jgi:hypothetical protein